MRAHFKLLTAVLVDMRGMQDRVDVLSVGRGIGPDTIAPVFFAVSTIFTAL